MGALASLVKPSRKRIATGAPAPKSMDQARSAPRWIRGEGGGLVMAILFAMARLSDAVRRHRNASDRLA